VWDRGHVHIKLLGDLPVGSGSLAEAKLGARYLGKYAGKSIDDGRPASLHRYEVDQMLGIVFCHVFIAACPTEREIARSGPRPGSALACHGVETPFAGDALEFV
jgi:hypothetical protein